MSAKSLQETYAPNNACWGCGPANTEGLHIRSFPKNGEVTAEYAIKLLRPTPTNDSIFLSAKVVDLTDDRATVEGILSAAGKVCATCRGTFVAVKEGHPAYHRW